MWTQLGPRKHVDGVDIGATRQIRLNCLCAVAIRPFCQITVNSCSLRLLRHTIQQPFKKTLPLVVHTMQRCAHQSSAEENIFQVRNSCLSMKCNIVILKRKLSIYINLKKHQPSHTCIICARNQSGCGTFLCIVRTVINSFPFCRLKGDMQRFFTKLMKK